MDPAAPNTTAFLPRKSWEAVMGFGNSFSWIGRRCWRRHHDHEPARAGIDAAHAPTRDPTVDFDERPPGDPGGPSHHALGGRAGPQARRLAPRRRPGRDARGPWLDRPDGRFGVLCGE